MEFIKKYKKTEWTQRLAKNNKLRLNYPDRIPIIIDRQDKSDPQPSRHKFLVHCSLTVADFLFVIRKHMPTLKPEQALFLYFGEEKTMVPLHTVLLQLYIDHHDKDNSLYCTIGLEKVFG